MCMNLSMYMCVHVCACVCAYVCACASFHVSVNIREPPRLLMGLPCPPNSLLMCGAFRVCTGGMYVCMRTQNIYVCVCVGRLRGAPNTQWDGSMASCSHHAHCIASTYIPYAHNEPMHHFYTTYAILKRFPRRICIVIHKHTRCTTHTRNLNIYAITMMQNTRARARIRTTIRT